MQLTTYWFLVPVAVITSVACSRQRAEPPVQPAPSRQMSTAAPTNQDSINAADAARRDSVARQARLREERDRRVREARSQIEASIHFAYDRADLSAESRQLLDAKIEILKASPQLRVRLSGHTDDRGSDEYNLALGQRRAASARQYLVFHGVTENQLQAVSFGEEQPACEEANESCWLKNRRVEFSITAGADEVLAEPPLGHREAAASDRQEQAPTPTLIAQ